MCSWFPVEWSSRLHLKPQAFNLNGSHLVLFRSKEKIHTLLDRCPHRGTSLKDVVENALDPLHTHSTRQERLLINGFLSSINEHCSKIFLVPSTDAPISGFVFKALVKPLFAVALKQDKKILEMRSKHIQKFGAGKEVSTSGDLFGPYFDLLLQGKELIKKKYVVQLYV